MLTQINLVDTNGTQIAPHYMWLIRYYIVRHCVIISNIITLYYIIYNEFSHLILH